MSKIILKNRYRIITAILLTVTAMFILLPFCANSEEKDMTLDVSCSIPSGGYVSAGENVTVTVSIGEVNNGFSTGKLCFTASDNLTYISATLLGNEVQAKEKSGYYSIVYLDTVNFTGTKTELCSITFKVNSADSGNAVIGFYTDQMKNSELESLDISILKDSVSVNVRSALPTIVTDKLDDGKIGQVYSAVIRSDTDGAVFKVSGGRLPNGLSLDANGTLSGVPSESGSFTFDVTAAVGASDSEPVTYTLYIAPISTKLSTPTQLRWEGKTAVWANVKGASDYLVKLFKDGKETDTEVLSDGAVSVDMSAYVKSGAGYTFSVMAIADVEAGTYTDSDFSEQSGTLPALAPLSTPKIELTQNIADSGFTYLITDPNGKGTVSEYTVEFYTASGTSPAKTVTVKSKSGNIPCDTELKGGVSYRARVRAIPTDTAKYDESEPSGYSEAVTAARKVTAMTLAASPRNTYTEGEVLDLSKTVVKVTYENGTSENVPYTGLQGIGITASMISGTVLTLSDNATSVIVTAPSGVMLCIADLVVKPSACKHEVTDELRTEATCGTDGSVKLVCASCGAVTSVKKIPATGSHSFGAAKIAVEATEKTAGLKVRECTVCGAKYEEIIPTKSGGDTESGSADTDAPDTRVSTDTDTSETGKPYPTDDENDDTASDISKIFLIAVIVVFSLVILLFIYMKWAEKRRKKMRRSRASNKASAKKARHDGSVPGHQSNKNTDDKK